MATREEAWLDAISWLIGLLAGALILFLLAVRRRDRLRGGTGQVDSPPSGEAGAGFLDDSSSSHHGHDGHGVADGGDGAGHGSDGGGGGHH